MDHEEYLGHTLAEIASEKAATIRPGVTAIIAPQEGEALQVILDRCRAVGVRPRLVDSSEHLLQGTEASADGRYIVTFANDNNEPVQVRLGLRGQHQIVNASIAIALAAALRERGFPINRAAIAKGIELARHSGRLEINKGRSRILFDGAHNPAAARVLRDYLDEFVTEPITLIFGAMRDKALNKMAGILFPKADELILASVDNPRAASIEMLLAAVPSSSDKNSVHQTASVAEALQLARRITPPPGLICVTGSLHLVGAVQEILDHESRRVAHQPMSN